MRTVKMVVTINMPEGTELTPAETARFINTTAGLFNDEDWRYSVMREGRDVYPERVQIMRVDA